MRGKHMRNTEKGKENGKKNMDAGQGNKETMSTRKE